MQTRRITVSHILLGVNVSLVFVLVVSFLLRGAKFTAPWDGPSVVTIALAAATIVLAAVALGVALLAVWGYNALRAYAESVASSAASAAADKKVQELLRAWGLEAAETASEEIASSYAKGSGDA